MAELIIYEAEMSHGEMERMMKEPFNYEEELTLEELMGEKIDVEAMIELGAEATDAASPISIPSNNSTMKRLQDLEMINSIPSLSDGGWKRGSDGADDTATSKLKGGLQEED